MSLLNMRCYYDQIVDGKTDFLKDHRHNVHKVASIESDSGEFDTRPYDRDYVLLASSFETLFRTRITEWIECTSDDETVYVFRQYLSYNFLQIVPIAPRQLVESYVLRLES